MKPCIAILLLCLLCIPAVAAAQGDAPSDGAPAPITEEQKPAIKAAKTWLAGIDAGNYAESWQKAAPSFQKYITEKDWATALTAIRKPLGTLGSRSVTRAKSLTTMPGAPDGAYVVMEFAATFANKKIAFETVTFARQADDSWRAVGYYIR
ncbi:MAG: DUF4019 domain-containing protein [Desulfovibrio sp.]